MENTVEAHEDMQTLFGGIYRDKTVFITGHSGFKGSWLTLWLKALGAKVVGYSLAPPTEPNLFEAIGISGSIEHIIGDVREYEEIVCAMEACRPEIVFHLAAQTIVRQAYCSPRLTYDTNVMGTVNVLEAIRQTPSVRVCINITSDKCYENKDWVYSYRENDPMGGYDPYSSSKAGAEFVAAAYRRSFFNPQKDTSRSLGLVSMRAGNVIGGGDWAQDRIIPDCVRALSRNVAIPVRNPLAVRPWQYILDPLSAYLWMGNLLWQNHDKYDYGWNIGPAVSPGLSVKQLVEIVVKIWGKGRWEDKSDSTEVYEANTLRLDCSKAANLIRWMSCYSVQESVEKTIEWYYKYYNDADFDAYNYTLAQIIQFVEKARNRNIIWAQEKTNL